MLTAAVTASRQSSQAPWPPSPTSVSLGGLVFWAPEGSPLLLSAQHAARPGWAVRTRGAPEPVASLQLLLQKNQGPTRRMAPGCPDSREGLPERTARARDRMPCDFRRGEERAVPTGKATSRKVCERHGQQFCFKTVDTSHTPAIVTGRGASPECEWAGQLGTCFSTLCFSGATAASSKSSCHLGKTQ